MEQQPPDDRMLASFHKALAAAKPKPRSPSAKEGARDREQRRRSEMTPDETVEERERARRRRVDMTPDDREAEQDRARLRRLEMTPDAREAEQGRARLRCLQMTPEEMEARRVRDRVRHLQMTPADIEAERGRRSERRADASPDAVAAERARSQRRRDQMRAHRRDAPWRSQSDDWQWDELRVQGYGRIPGMTKVCPHCSAQLFKDEPKGICCLNGAIRLQPVGFPPEPLATYLRERSPLSSHFREAIRLYNTAFAMASPEGGLYLSSVFSSQGHPRCHPLCVTCPHLPQGLPTSA
jgi:hypothetical protein